MPPIRDVERDKGETRKLIPERNRPPYTGGGNWLCHGKHGGKDAVIDYLLLEGATMERLLQERGTKNSVYSHFQSLKTLHDLPVTRGPDGKYRFDRVLLGLPDGPALRQARLTSRCRRRSCRWPVCSKGRSAR